MFNDSWKHNFYVENKFVSTPSGIVVACVLSFLGLLHKSHICDFENLYEEMEIFYKWTEGNDAIDFAFWQSDFFYLITSAQDKTHAEGLPGIILLQQATAAKELVEWEMEALQGTFSRLKNGFIYEKDGERTFC